MTSPLFTAISAGLEAGYSEARYIGMVKADWLNADSDVKDQWQMVTEAIVNAAISAIRVPTSDMISAARVATYDALSDAGYEKCWTSMLDRIVAPEKVG